MPCPVHLREAQVDATNDNSTFDTSIHMIRMTKDIILPGLAHQ